MAVFEGLECPVFSSIFDLKLSPLCKEWFPLPTPKALLFFALEIVLLGLLG